MGTLTEQGREFLFAPPLSDFPLYTLMADGSGIAIIERPAATDAGTHEFRLLRIDPVGDTVLTRAYSYDPTATPPGEVDRQVALLLERYSSSPQRPSREGVARIVEGPGFLPPYLPPVSSARSGQDGSIWIQREVVGPDSVAWNKIDTTGTRKGEIWLPLTAQIMAAQGDLVAVLELNELDVPYVVVYRVMY